MRREAPAVLAVLLALAALVAPPSAGASERDDAPLRPLRVDLRPLYGPQPPRGRRAEDAERVRPRGRFRPAFVFLAAPMLAPALSQAEPRRLDEQKSPGRHKAATPSGAPSAL